MVAGAKWLAIAGPGFSTRGRHDDQFSLGVAFEAAIAVAGGEGTELGFGDGPAIGNPERSRFVWGRLLGGIWGDHRSIGHG
jgi:hypothetical protein